MDFKIGDLPPYGKTFVGLFCVLVLVVLICMTVLGFLHVCYSGYSGNGHTSASTIRMETMLAANEAVTDPVWNDSVRTKVVDDPVMPPAREESTFGMMLQENLEWAMEHVGTQALLFFALGFLFVGTSFSDSTKKRFFWISFVLIVLHVISLIGSGFCQPSNILLYTTGPLLIITFAIMTFMILAELRKKS